MEDFLCEVYYPLIALNMLTNMFLYQANESWGLFGNNISKHSADEIYATVLLMKLISEKLLKLRKVYHWKICKNID